MNKKEPSQNGKKARIMRMLALKIACFTCATCAYPMATKSLNQYDKPRAKLYSAFVYAGDMKFRKSICENRGKKSGKCYKWKIEYLDLKIKEDEEFIRSSMILIGEAEL